HFSFLLSFSLLAQRILNQVQHRHQQKKVRFSRGVFAFSFLEKNQNRINFSKFLPWLQKFLTKNQCYTAEKIMPLLCFYVELALT
ncbi:MAG: hypothetical protein AAF617_08455, partial [Bacteroidota bacterium]